jgi:FO synthase
MDAAGARALAESDTAELLSAAASLRERGRGRLVTYSRKVFIPLTKLCRDVCHYCTFAAPPKRGERAYLSPDEVLAIARAGVEAGCDEALFTLGDKPELRYRAAREELASRGAETTLEYLAEMCSLVMSETGLLPHANAGVMTEGELAMLRAVTASQGIMLESSSERLCEPGAPHHGSPDKLPSARLGVLEAAGRLEIPFTTGLLIGIGETRGERIDALLAIKSLHERYGHIQEVIIQNFRAKPGTKMAEAPEPSFDELLWSIATARLVLGAGMRIQAPPNLSLARFPELLDAGIDDWGGVSPVTIDHVNPEAPWPELEALGAATRARGFELVPRLTAYPEYVAEPERWLDSAVRPYVLRRSDAEGFARTDAWTAGDPEPPPRRAVDELRSQSGGGRGGEPVGAVLGKVAADEPLGEADVLTLFTARGRDVGRVCEAADDLRRRVCGDTVTYVVTRNINYTNVCYFRCGFCAFSKGKLARNLRGKPYLVPLDEVVRRSREAWDRGAVEVCLQGGIHPGFTGDHYLEICAALKAELPRLHIHAFSALEVWQGAATLGLPLDEYLERLRDAGLGSLPGTAAEILDDEVRQVICPDKLSTADWLEVHDTAHAVGLRSTTTMMFGHVEHPRSWARHLLALREQQQRSGRFTEFVPLPFVHMEAPIYRRGAARRGPTLREAVLVHAVARLALHPWITNIQASWVKLGVEGTQLVLQSGANDFGGTLMNESISRAAGAAHGQEMPPERIDAAIRAIGRMPLQRTTLYGVVPRARQAASRDAPPLSEPLNPPAREAGLRPRAQLVRTSVAAKP